MYDHYTVFDPSGTRFAVGLYVYDRANSYMYQVDELLVTDTNKMSVGQIWPIVKAKEMKWYPGWADPLRIYDEAAKLFAIEMADQFGISVAPTSKKQNDKSNNISLIRDALVQERFLIAEHCVNTIDDIFNYHYDDNGKIVKKKDDLVDCALYVFAESGYSLTVEAVIEGEEKRFYTPEEDYIRRSDETDWSPHNDGTVESVDIEEDLWLSSIF